MKNLILDIVLPSLNEKTLFIPIFANKYKFLIFIVPRHFDIWLSKNKN